MLCPDAVLNWVFNLHHNSSFAIHFWVAKFCLQRFFKVWRVIYGTVLTFFLQFPFWLKTVRELSKMVQELNVVSFKGFASNMRDKDPIYHCVHLRYFQQIDRRRKSSGVPPDSKDILNNMKWKTNFYLLFSQNSHCHGVNLWRTVTIQPKSRKVFSLSAK